MRAPQRTALLILAGGALLGLAAWALLSPTRQAGGGKPAPAAAVTPEPEKPAVEAIDPAPADRTALGAPAPPAPAPSTGGPPASYTRSLGRLLGRILDWDGTPVPDLTVDAYVVDLVSLFPATSALFEEETVRPKILDASGRTNVEGRFVLEGLDPRMPHALLLGLGTPRATARFLDHAPGSGETVDIGDIVLPPFATLVGKVVDEKERPVPGARVRVTDLPAIVVAMGASEVRPGGAFYVEKNVFEFPRWLDDIVERFPIPTTTTGPDGSFRLEGAPVAPNVSTVVDHPKFVTLTRDPVSTAEGGERDLGMLQLEAGETLAGTVVDTEDRPVAGAEILAGTKIPLGPAAVMRSGGRTDGEGKFRVPAMASEPAFVACRRGPPDPWTVAGPFVPGLDPAAIRLPSLRQVELSVLDDAGTPVREGIEILYRRDAEWNLVAVLAPPVRATWKRGAEEGAYVVERVPDGKYQFLVRAPGYAVGEAQVDVQGGAGRARVTLDRAVPLVVRVVAEGSGETIEYVYVAGRPGEKAAIQPPVVSARTDAGGEARLAGLREGKNPIWALHPAYAFVQEEVTLPAESVTFRLHAGGTVEGKVHSGGGPPPDSVMVVAGPEGAKFRMPRFTATDAAGSFKMTNVDPGTYKFVALPRLSDKTFSGLFEFAEVASEMAEVEGTVEEGKTTTVEIDLRGEAGENVGTIRGRAWVNGRPAEGALVRAWSKRARTTKVDASGVYELTGVPAGDVRVNLSLPRDDGIPGGQQLQARRVKLQTGAVEEVSFELETGRLAGKVLSAKAGTPIPYAQVWARRVPEQGEEREGWSNPFAVADSEGRFRMAAVRAGTYDVSARMDRYANATARATVTAGGDTADVVLSLSSAIVVKGRIVFDAAPDEKQWMGLSFHRGPSEEHDWAGWARVRLPEGTFETDDLGPGTYTVRVNGPDVRYRRVEVVVPEGGTDALVIQAVRETEPEARAAPAASR
ncbi:MAG: carboxypeptidase-like regulatory domain-containing protein [Planctomycetes bacterium]|nr:carboxypeptidase-like regulatory domain-containing protein [Planctomycetota bacterium]